MNEMIPYHRAEGYNPIYPFIAFKILQSWKFLENQWFNRKGGGASNGPNEKSCIRSPTFIPSVSLLLVSQLVSIQVVFFSANDDGYRDGDQEADLQEMKVCIDQTRDPEREEGHDQFFEGFQPRQ